MGAAHNLEVSNASGESLGLPDRSVSDVEPTTSLVDVVYPVRTSPRVMVRTFLDCPSRRFEFKKTFVLKIEQSEFGFEVNHPGLPCNGSGSSVEDAILEFCEMFEVQWEALVDCSRDDLTAGAARARDAFIELASPLPRG